MRQAQGKGIKNGMLVRNFKKKDEGLLCQLQHNLPHFEPQFFWKHFVWSPAIAF